MQDTRNLKAGLIAVGEAFARVGWSVPVMASVTIEPMGTMLAGQAIDALYASIMHAPLLSIGLNCATGPEFMTDHIRTLSGLTRTLVSCYPNAGLPDVDGCYPETPERIAAALERFVDEGWVNIVGGCCGTTPAHIRALARAVEGRRPRRIPIHGKTLVSGIEALEIDVDNRPVLIGERTNVLGSRKFKRLVAQGSFEAAAEIARAQVRGGAQIIDVCLQDPDRDEAADAEAFLARVTRMVKVPLMLDSTDPKVMEIGLKWSQGKSILNSVNLEDGEETSEGIRAIKGEVPQTKTILGISNVSFGLPEAGREVLNSVFLYHCVKAGLDLAIVNSEKVMRYPSIPDEEKRLAEDLLYNRGADPIAAFAEHFKGRKAAAKEPKERAG